ncbi:MerR family transcriptional regulator [Exilibacterium tricleocarpae]|uniref:MerR family transcriptional regulator n=1 Tax=Exilibacterium tricleocarpae TaxID=2591008 RepID=A0A545U6Q6_9GAMM|nr:chaperone modulator CbpM [Exilibacterium tricleocarpae]TQV85156.1 MerR family transcriptional regulator [Exilibacterium tricleocarpae]
MNETRVLQGILLDEEARLSLAELSQACRTSADWVIALVDEGILEPEGGDLAHWRFSGVCLRRAQSVRRFQRDLGVNLAGAALALELLDELTELQVRLMWYETRGR